MKIEIIIQSVRTVIKWHSLNALNVDGIKFLI